MAIIYFPLRTSITLFADPLAPTAVAKVKEAAVLFDRVLIEPGAYEITLSTLGSTADAWTPADKLTPAHLTGTRRPVRPGADYARTVNDMRGRGGNIRTRAPHIPPVYATYSQDGQIEGKTLAHYAVEFHTKILDDLTGFDFDWIGEALPIDWELHQETVVQFYAADLEDPAPLPGLAVAHQKYVRDAFNHDLLLSCLHEATFSVTRLFMPMLERRGLAIPRTGDQALRIVVPNIAQLPWETIAEFREHPNSQEARAMLREFEDKADQQSPNEAYRWLETVAQQVTAAYADSLHATIGTIPEELSKQALLTGVGYIPAVGPFVAGTSGAAQVIRQVMRKRKTWAAALWQLQSPTRK